MVAVLYGLKPGTTLCALCALWLFCATAQAQWRTETYSLKGGWNSIYLHGDARQDAIANLFPVEVTEVWRWNPNPTQVQFTESPLIPSEGTPEWSVWKRGVPAQTTLTQLTGQAAYLVKCTGTISNTYSAPLRQAHQLPLTSWVRNGANLLGFPTRLSGTFPLFTNYFATFPAATAVNTRIYKYVGGDLGPANPQQVFSPSLERLDRTQAYWFSAEVVGNFYAPLEISFSSIGGLVFGRTGQIVTARVRNRTSAAVTLTLAPVNSEAAPLSQTGITGPVPLTRRTYNSTLNQWTETAISGAYTEVIGPQATVELNFGINRTHASMTGAAAGAYFASFLRLTDSSNLADIYVPTSATKASLAGLWIGEITVTNVSSRVSNPAQARASISGGQVTGITLTGTGGFGYTAAPVVTLSNPISGTAATATATVANGSVTGFTITSAGSGYERAPRVTVAAPPPLTDTGVARPFALRCLIHVAEDGNTQLLSQAFIGQLATAPHDVGVCTQEGLLKQDARNTAQRFICAHLPLDQVIGGSGTIAVPGVLTRTVTVAMNDPTNPFLHLYHPDHDNKDARFDPVVLQNSATAQTARMSDGAEAPAIIRNCAFTFTAGASDGSSLLGGTYRETLTGLHKNTLQIDGSFSLRRASEIGTLTQ